MFGHDVRARDWRDDKAVHFLEADRNCIDCGDVIATGTRCTPCRLAMLLDVAGDEGGEA